ncbi:hypothetical protein BU065_07385 [Staphylococcus succinus]|nr:hypothetical protein BU065_07385 [Staphylococcus succinus]
MTKRQIAKWERVIRISVSILFFILLVLNAILTTFEDTNTFYFSQNVLLLIFVLILGICGLFQFFSKTSNGYMRKTILLVYASSYLNILLIISVFIFHLEKLLGVFSIIMAFCFLNFLFLNLIERRFKKRIKEK